MSDAVSNQPTGFGLWLAGARPKTLPAAVVPVAVGTAAVAERDLGGVIWWRFVAAMIVSLALQVAVNYANDYSDGVRGTDDDRVGPLRLVGSGLASAKSVKLAALGALGVAGVFGLTLAAAAGWELLLVGLASMAAAWLYTGGPKPYGYLGLGELFVFVFFGLVATVGSAYVQTESISGVAVVAAVPVGLIAVALLVTNNLRDIPGDTVSGKRTLAVRLGDRSTRYLFVFLVVATVLGGAALALDRGSWMLMALVALPLAAKVSKTVLDGAVGRELIAVLEQTGKLQLVFGVLMTAGLVLSAGGS